MKQTTERFQKAYDALIEAYFEGSLAKGDCLACAVGNICKKPAEVLGIERQAWKHLFITTDEDGCTQFKADIKKGESAFLKSIYDSSSSDGTHIREGLNLIKETGYDWEELAQVEYAFERNTSIDYQRYDEHTEQEILEDQYNGLVAVVEVLCRLDGIEDVQQRQDKFKEHPKLLMA